MILGKRHVLNPIVERTIDKMETKNWVDEFCKKNGLKPKTKWDTFKENASKMFFHIVEWTVGLTFMVLFVSMLAYLAYKLGIILTWIK